MINSRRLYDLHPIVATKCAAHVKACSEAGIDIILTSTYRDFESQDALYAQGRTAPGRIVTNAKGGQSYHNYKVAYDVVPLRNGKPVWDSEDPVWKQVGELGKQAGLDWAGDWKRFKEFPHFQFTGGLTIADFQKGMILPSFNHQ